MNQQVQYITAISKRIREDHQGRDWQGSEDCPICCNTLHLSHSKAKGHVAGICEKKGCLRWME